MNAVDENTPLVRRIGAVNWDCSVPSDTFFGKATTWTLGPAKWRDRTPYYADIVGEDRIEHHYRSLGEYAAISVMRNAVRATAGLPVVPHFSVGWDPTPRIERPNPWSWYPAWNYAPPLSREEMLDEATMLLRWIERNREECPTDHVMIFAWNEFEEGGWICPNVGLDGHPDVSRVRAFREVAEALKTGVFPQKTPSAISAYS